MDENNTPVEEVQNDAAPVTEQPTQTPAEPAPVEPKEIDPSDTLGMINLLNKESEAPEPTKDPEPIDEDKAAEDKRAEILRQIAVNPHLSQQYAQQYQQPQFYQQPQQQQQAFSPQLDSTITPIDEPQSVLPFDADTFDATDLSHQEALLTHKIEQVGQPLFEQLENIQKYFTQAEQTVQQQQEQEAIQKSDEVALKLMDTYVPAFSGIIEKMKNQETLSPKERSLVNTAANDEARLLEQYPQAVYDPQLRAQIIQHIGVGVQELAQALGLESPASTPVVTPEQKQQYAREMYVESSNQVPVSTVTQFDKAHKTGDLLGMISAL